MNRPAGVPLASRAFLLAAGAGAAIAFDPVYRPAALPLALYCAGGACWVDADHGSHRGGWRRVFEYGFAALCATILCFTRGWPMAWVALGLGFGSRAYFVGPRLAETRLAAPLTVVLFGPIAAAGASLALVGHVAPGAVAAGFPLGFLADAVRRSRLPVPAGGNRARVPAGVVFDLTAGFSLHAAIALFGTVPVVSLAALAAIPFGADALRLGPALQPSVSEPAVAGLDGARFANPIQRLQLVFGVLVTVAMLVSRVVATRAV